MSKIGTVPLLLAVGLLVLILFFSTCTYVIDERQQAVVTRLSKPIKVIVGARKTEAEFELIRQEILAVTQRADMAGDANVDNPEDLEVSQGAGLRFKLPFGIDKVEIFPDVVMVYDAEPREIVLADKKKLELDNFGRWRVINPLLFRVRVQNERNARERLDDIIYSNMREVLGKNPLIEVIRTDNRYSDTETAGAVDETAVEDEIELRAALSEQNPMREDIQRGREELMQTVSARSDAEAREKYGIQIIDVRIKRADLLKENLEAVFGRMQAERARISDAYRSEGKKEANIIRGETDRQVQVIAANAERDAKILHGEGDAQSLSIISDAFGANPELYRFMRSLEVLEDATPAGSEVIMGLNSGLFELLQTNTLDE
ncbi:MAG: hypothetical protein DHS20C16_35760 [Phycisphaerae bacterium]|nr:MAG: hypothetical protein DHS20C16_35760 [Phycisphaerae bacterium]